MRELIVIENLSKYYNKFLALDGLSLRIAENENVGLLGPNGAGKSTTLKILCGLIRSSSGAAYIDGINVAKKPEQALSRIGAIIETPDIGLTTLAMVIYLVVGFGLSIWISGRRQLT